MSISECGQYYVVRMKFNIWCCCQNENRTQFNWISSIEMEAHFHLFISFYNLVAWSAFVQKLFDMCIHLQTVWKMTCKRILRLCMCRYVWRYRVLLTDCVASHLHVQMLPQRHRNCTTLIIASKQNLARLFSCAFHRKVFNTKSKYALNPKMSSIAMHWNVPVNWKTMTEIVTVLRHALTLSESIVGIKLYRKPKPFEWNFEIENEMHQKNLPHSFNETLSIWICPATNNRSEHR